METNNTCALVLPRSGLSAKTNLRVCNSPGLIDKDYRGEICVILQNIGDEPVTVKRLDRIAQLMFITYQENDIQFIDEFKNETVRGTGGFGRTGVNG
jgi:dUTP pyrophosphatase